MDAVHLSKSRNFPKMIFDKILVTGYAIFLLNRLPWWDEFVLKVSLSVRIEFECVITRVESEESRQYLADFSFASWRL